jgi:hypothetical protein
VVSLIHEVQGQLTTFKNVHQNLFEKKYQNSFFVNGLNWNLLSSG